MASTDPNALLPLCSEGRAPKPIIRVRVRVIIAVPEDGPPLAVLGDSPQLTLIGDSPQLTLTGDSPLFSVPLQPGTSVPGDSSRID